MPLTLIFEVSFFLFILSMIGTLASFFDQRWKWFWWLLACVIVSGACTLFVLYQWFGPPLPHDLPVILRQPPVPL